MFNPIKNSMSFGYVCKAHRVTHRGFRFFSRVPSLTKFPEDLDALRSSVRLFANLEILPKVADMDQNAMMCPELSKKLFDQGYMGIEIPEIYGGSGLNFMDSIIVIEELSRVDPSVGILVDIHNTLVNRASSSMGVQKVYIRNVNRHETFEPVIDYGSVIQKETFLPRLAVDTIASFALSEPDAGSDAFSLRTSAEKMSNGDYILRGEKAWISNSREAGLFLVFARTEGHLGMDGISAFLVDPLEHKGVEIGKPEQKLGIKASSTCSVWLNDVQVPDTSILGGVGIGGRMAISLLNEGRIGIAAQMLGISKAALTHSLSYAQHRKQFGSKLSEFQAVQHQLAEMATDVHASELLVYNAARLKETALPKDIIKNCSMAKLYASRTAERATSLAIEILGGVGFTRHFPVEKLYRDAKIGSIYEGTSNIQLNTISQQILRDDYLP